MHVLAHGADAARVADGDPDAHLLLVRHPAQGVLDDALDDLRVLRHFGLDDLAGDGQHERDHLRLLPLPERLPRRADVGDDLLHLRPQRLLFGLPLGADFDLDGVAPRLLPVVKALLPGRLAQRLGLDAGVLAHLVGLAPRLVQNGG